MDTLKLFVAVKICLINEHNEVLLLRESNTYKDGTNIGKYDVPGGRINISESLTEAFTREVHEETGLSISEYQLFDVQDTFNKKDNETWHIVRIFYKAKYKGEKITLSEDHDAYVWAPLSTIENFKGIISNLIPVLNKI